MNEQGQKTGVIIDLAEYLKLLEAVEELEAIKAYDRAKAEGGEAIPFDLVPTDNWFSSKENMGFIKLELEKEFVMALKSNRTVALSLEDQRQGRFVRVDSLPLEEGTVLQVYIKGLPFPVVLAKQVFTNQDGSTGLLYLASSDLLLDDGRITAIYQKRWNERGLSPIGQVRHRAGPLADPHRQDAEQPLASVTGCLGHALHAWFTSTSQRVGWRARHYPEQQFQSCVTT